MWAKKKDKFVMSCHSMQTLAKDATWMEAFSYLGQEVLQYQPVSVVESLGRVFFLDVRDVAHPRVLCAEHNQTPMEYGPACEFSRPSHITTAADGGFLVADTGNHRIMHLSPGAAEWVVVAGGMGRGCEADQLCFPRGAASLEDGSVLVADSNNHRVLHFPKDSREGFVIAGGRGPGKRADQLHGPCCIAVAPNKDLLVADTLNNRLLHFAPGASEGTPLLDQTVHNPISIACTKAGGILVAAAGDIIHLAPCARRATAVIERLKFPQGVMVTDAGHAIVCDTDKCRILYLSHRQGLRDFLVQLTGNTEKSLFATLRHDILKKVMSFL